MNRNGNSAAANFMVSAEPTMNETSVGDLANAQSCTESHNVTNFGHNQIDDYYEVISADGSIGGDDISDNDFDEHIYKGHTSEQADNCSFTDLPFVPKYEFPSEFGPSENNEILHVNRIIPYRPKHIVVDTSVPPPNFNPSFVYPGPQPSSNVVNPYSEPGLTIPNTDVSSSVFHADKSSSGSQIEAKLSDNDNNSCCTAEQASRNDPAPPSERAPAADWLDENGDPIKGAFDNIKVNPEEEETSDSDDKGTKIEYVFSVKEKKLVPVNIEECSVDSLMNSNVVSLKNVAGNLGFLDSQIAASSINNTKAIDAEEEKRLYEASKSGAEYKAALQVGVDVTSSQIISENESVKKERFSRFKRNRFTEQKEEKEVLQGSVKEEPQKSQEEAALESQAVTEILKEVQRGAARAKEFGALGWQKCPVPVTNKTFLRNTLVSTLKEPYRPPSKRGRFHVGLNIKEKDKHDHKDHEDDISSSRSSSSSGRRSYSRSRSSSYSHSRSHSSRSGSSDDSRHSSSRSSRRRQRGGGRGGWGPGHFYDEAAWAAYAAHATQYGYPWYGPEAYAMYYGAEGWPVDAYAAMYYRDPQAWAEYEAYYGPQNFHPRGRGRGRGRGGWGRGRGGFSYPDDARDFGRESHSRSPEFVRSRSRSALSQSWSPRPSRSHSQSWIRDESSRDRSHSGSRTLDRRRSKSGSRGHGKAHTEERSRSRESSEKNRSDSESRDKKKKRKKKKKKHRKSKKSKHRREDGEEKLSPGEGKEEVGKQKEMAGGKNEAGKKQVEGENVRDVKARAAVKSDSDDDDDDSTREKGSKQKRHKDKSKKNLTRERSPGRKGGLCKETESTEKGELGGQLKAEGKRMKKGDGDSREDEVAEGKHREGGGTRRLEEKKSESHSEKGQGHSSLGPRHGEDRERASKKETSAGRRESDEKDNGGTDRKRKERNKSKELVDSPGGKYREGDTRDNKRLPESRSGEGTQRREGSRDKYEHQRGSSQGNSNASPHHSRVNDPNGWYLDRVDKYRYSGPRDLRENLQARRLKRDKSHGKNDSRDQRGETQNATGNRGGRENAVWHSEHVAGGQERVVNSQERRAGGSINKDGKSDSQEGCPRTDVVDENRRKGKFEVRDKGPEKGNDNLEKINRDQHSKKERRHEGAKTKDHRNRGERVTEKISDPKKTRADHGDRRKPKEEKEEEEKDGDRQKERSNTSKTGERKGRDTNKSSNVKKDEGAGKDKSVGTLEKEKRNATSRKSGNVQRQDWEEALSGKTSKRSTVKATIGNTSVAKDQGQVVSNTKSHVDSAKPVEIASHKDVVTNKEETPDKSAVKKGVKRKKKGTAASTGKPGKKKKKLGKALESGSGVGAKQSKRSKKATIKGKKKIPKVAEMDAGRLENVKIAAVEDLNVTRVEDTKTTAAEVEEGKMVE